MSLRWGDCSMNALDENNPVHKQILERIISPQTPINQQPDNGDVKGPKPTNNPVECARLVQRTKLTGY